MSPIGREAEATLACVSGRTLVLTGLPSDTARVQVTLILPRRVSGGKMTLRSQVSSGHPLRNVSLSTVLVVTHWETGGAAT